MSGSEDRRSTHPPFFNLPDAMSCEEEPSDNDRIADESEDDTDDKGPTVFLRPPPSLTLPCSGGSLFGHTERVPSPRGTRRQRAISRTRSLHRSSECLLPNAAEGPDRPQCLKRTQSPNAHFVQVKRSRSVQGASHCHNPTDPPVEPGTARRQLFSPRLRRDRIDHVPMRNSLPSPAVPIATPTPTPISLQSISQPVFFSSVSAPEIPLPTILDEENVPQTNGVPRRPRSGAMSVTPGGVRRSVSDLSSKSAPRGALSMSCSYLPAPMNGDIHDTLYPPILPILPKAKQFQEISGSTLVDLIEGRFDGNFERFIIIDCRSTLEYDGGHIRGALSIVPADLEQRLQEMFMNNPVVRRNWAIIFHCEFSAVRGPRGWETLRRMDRTAIGIGNYPHCYYPYMYVLHKGYCEFHHEWPEYCDGGYIAMSAKDKTCDRLLRKKSAGLSNPFSKRK